MGAMILVCSHCLKPGGCMHLVALLDGAGQPPPAAAPAPAQQPPGRRQQPRQAAADTDAPICGRCGIHRVGRRRNGSYFATCYECGG